MKRSEAMVFFHYNTLTEESKEDSGKAVSSVCSLMQCYFISMSKVLPRSALKKEKLNLPSS